MSDFLERENELLGGEFSGPTGTGTAGGADDDIDFDRAASAFPDIDLDGNSFPAIPTSAGSGAAPGAGGFDFDSFDAPQQKMTQVKVTGGDEIDDFESQFPDIGAEAQTFSPPPQPTFGVTPTFAPRPQPSALSSTPILTQPIDEDEPKVIKEWREKQQEQIAARDAASAKKREETIAKAERAIDEFYEEYSAKQEKAVRENKIKEEEYLTALTESLSQGTTWSRICDFVELQNSQSKTLARTGPGTTELKRMREVLLGLMREGPNAPGAAGY